MLEREAGIGSLTVGKKADLVIVNADDLNLVPVHDPGKRELEQSGLRIVREIERQGRAA